MKKTYEAPLAEVVRFEYKDQVVVASGTCNYMYYFNGQTSCQGEQTGGYISTTCRQD